MHSFMDEQWNDDRRINTVNNGFWDRPPEERSAIMQSACERGGVSDFFDLSAEERAAAYDRE